MTPLPRPLPFSPPSVTLHLDSIQDLSKFIYIFLRAAVAIQRYWRKYKGYKYASKKLKKRLASGKGAKKASTPLEPKAVHEMSTLPAPSHAKSSIPSTTNREADLAVRSKLDYDTYMKNRRPGSISPGLQSLDNQQSGMTPLDRPQVKFGWNLWKLNVK